MFDFALKQNGRGQGILSPDLCLNILGVDIDATVLGRVRQGLHINPPWMMDTLNGSLSRTPNFAGCYGDYFDAFSGPQDQVLAGLGEQERKVANKILGEYALVCQPKDNWKLNIYQVRRDWIEKVLARVGISTLGADMLADGFNTMLPKQSWDLVWCWQVLAGAAKMPEDLRNRAFAMIKSLTKGGGNYVVDDLSEQFIADLFSYHYSKDRKG